jgi:RNA ligase (TIGR02306 family)
MTRKLATVDQILDIQPIPNADLIVKAKVRGWWCVVGKDQFKIGDPCIYFEIDSLLPTDNPIFDGLGKYNSLKTQDECTGYRIRTVKLRGQISQGLVLPYDGDLPTGTDLTEQLGVLKYDPYSPGVRLQSDNGAEGLFPGFIPKTDEDRVQNLDIADILGKSFSITEKLDGTSFTAYKHEGAFKVCSRNLILREDDSSIYWKLAKRYDLQSCLSNGYAVQGEIIGEGIQGNPLKLKGQELYLFYLYSIQDRKYVDNFNSWNLKKVPYIDQVVFGSHTIEDIVAYADKRTSLLNLHRQAEGVVFHQIVNGFKTSFKAINNTYLVKEKS